MEAVHFLKKPNKTEPDHVSRWKRTNGTNARSLLDLNNSTRQQNCSSSIAGADEWQIIDFHQPPSLCAEWRGTVETQASDRHTVFHFFLLFSFFLQQSQKWTDKSPSTNAEQKALSTSHNVPSSIAHSDGQSNWIKLRWLGASLQLLLFDMGFRCAASVNLARLERLADTLIFYTKLWAAVPMSHWP